MEDDEEEHFISEYENGHWEWDDKEGMLVFVRDNISIQDSKALTVNVLGSIDFRDDLDLMEQLRFRKRFQRKIGDEDVVKLQDIKDLVLFTAAPKVNVTSSIINVLHLPATERFLRSLILYCQYFIQIADEMAKRSLELQVKIRTETSNVVELEYQDNLEDLRILVAKEYSLLIQGGDEFAKYHHMGPQKRTTSLMRKELLFFELLLRFSIQIVWVAVGRTSHTQIESEAISKSTDTDGIPFFKKAIRKLSWHPITQQFEIHRLFKSDIYNVIEHHGGKICNEALSNEEWRILLGNCLKSKGEKLKTFSPLMNEVRCEKQIDYRLLGLGVIKYPRLNNRLRFFEQVLIAPEESFKDLGVSLGILGLQRLRFDTMLKEIKMPASTASSSATMKASMSRMMSTKSTKSGASIYSKLLTDVRIPEKEEFSLEIIPEHFPQELYTKRRCNDIQKRKWLTFLKRSRSTTNTNKTASNKRSYK